MKRWAFIIAALYIVILAILTVPAIMLAFVPLEGPVRAAGVFLAWPYWVWLAVMGISQLALLAVPVRVASLRPVTRGPVWRTLLAGGLMAAFLVVGACSSIYEFVSRLEDSGVWFQWIALGLGLLTWFIWAVVFARMSRSLPPTDLVSQQCRWLFKGSILEFLIAVPTHIVARSRDYCCAGIMTFLGLTMGISVMLFAYGPAVFFLYVERWKRLHPTPPSEQMAKN
jgi:hypothetical protein